MNLPSSPRLCDLGTSTGSRRGVITLPSAVPPCSAFSLSSTTVDGLEKEAVDWRVFVDKVLEGKPESFSPVAGCKEDGSTGSTGGEKLFSRSGCAINEVSEVEGQGSQLRVTAKVKESERERRREDEYSYHGQRHAMVEQTVVVQRA